MFFFFLFATYWQKIFQLGFSSKIEVPQLGSARAGKFELELIHTQITQIATQVGKYAQM